jgi:hypothetical protein
VALGARSDQAPAPAFKAGSQTRLCQPWSVPLLKSYVTVADLAGVAASRKRKAPKRVQTIRAEKPPPLGLSVDITDAYDAIPKSE